MTTKQVSPRIAEQTADFYQTLFQNKNQGTQYVLEAFPSLYKRALLSLKGYFNKKEVMLMVDVLDGSFLTPQLAGQNLIINVENGIDLDGLDKQFGIDKKQMMRKLKGLDNFQVVIIEIFCQAYFLQDQEINVYVKEIGSES